MKATRLGPGLKLGLAMVVLLGACTKSGAPATEAAEAETEAEAPLPEAQIAALLDAVPPDAAGVVTIATRTPLWESLTSGLFLPMDPEIAKELDAELGAHLEKAFGLDYRRAQAMVAFGKAQPPGGALLVSGIGGELANSTSTYQGAAVVLLEEDEDGSFVVAKLGDVLLLGLEASVHESIDRIASKAKGEGALRERIDAVREGANLAAVVSVDAIPQAAMLPIPGKISHASVRLGTDGARVAVTGDDAALDFLEAQYQMVETMAMAAARAEKDKAASDVAEGAGAILAYHYLSNTAKQLDPVRDGDELSLGLSFEGAEGGQAMTVTAVVGVLAAVAVPAFMKYIKKSKTVEARQSLLRLHQGVRASHAATGKLPASVGPTPPVGSCCLSGETCAVDAAQWQTPAWQALGFSVDDPHRYSYELRSEPGEFTVLAYGDLDCDGVYSTFSMYGTADGTIAGNETIAAVNELE